MSYTISDACIKCGRCAENCPMNCISEGSYKYEVNASQCIDCGTCANVCPVGAPRARA